MSAPFFNLSVSVLSVVKYVRLKDGKDEHDDEEEGVGREHRYLVDGLLRFFGNIISIYRRKGRIKA